MGEERGLLPCRVISDRESVEQRRVSTAFEEHVGTTFVEQPASSSPIRRWATGDV